MTGRQTTPRQDPLPPDVGFGELMTRMISANQAEKAKRARANGAGRTAPRDAPEPRGTLGTLRGVTLAAARAPLGGALFASFLEAVPDAIVGVVADGSILMVNAQAETLFGYGRDEMVGQQLEILVPASAGDHSQLRAMYFQEPQPRPMGLGMELSGKRRDGSEFPAEISLAWIEIDGLLLVVAAVRDITERKRAEAKFRSLLEAAPDAIVGVNTDGLIALVNTQAEALFGYERNQLIGRPVELLVPGAAEQYPLSQSEPGFPRSTHAKCRSMDPPSRTASRRVGVPCRGVADVHRDRGGPARLRGHPRCDRAR